MARDFEVNQIATTFFSSCPWNRSQFSNISQRLTFSTVGDKQFLGFNKDDFFALVSVSYLMYGPYGSFAPSYDSSRATITKEQSDLLYSTYGDDTGIHYAKRSVAFTDSREFKKRQRQRHCHKSII